MSRLKVLVTGPGGRIGPHVLPTLKEKFEVRVFDKKPLEGEDQVIGDLTDRDAIDRAMQGMDAVLHLAATSDEAPFLEQLVPNNVVGVYNIYEAAQQAGVKRVVFASTVQAVGFNKNHPIEADEVPHPNSMYGATKVFGETLGRWFHDKHGLEFIALRIGWFQDYDSPHIRRPGGGRDIWLSPRDAAGIFARALEKPDVGYAIVFATSNTEKEVLSRRNLRDILDYEPVDDVRQLVPEVNQ